MKYFKCETYRVCHFQVWTIIRTKVWRKHLNKTFEQRCASWINMHIKLVKFYCFLYMHCFLTRNNTLPWVVAFFIISTSKILNSTLFNPHISSIFRCCSCVFLARLENKPNLHIFLKYLIRSTQNEAVRVDENIKIYYDFIVHDDWKHS